MMSIQHHPEDAMLTSFAAGTLDYGQHVAIATHLVSCPQCRGFLHTMEQVGGAVLTSLPPSPMSSDALQQIEARLSEPAHPAPPVLAPPLPESEVPGLPAFVRRHRFGRWTWIAPSVHVRPIMLPHESDTRAFLLRAGAGIKMPQHTHTGVEMTCVLTGAFSHTGAHYGPGDFDFGDEGVDHRPVVDADRECICLVAMQGELRLNGLLGRLIQPFVRL
jgi:putative transcriptional regulator